MSKCKKDYNKAKRRKKYRLLHLPTAEYAFGTHSLAWWKDRLAKYTIYYSARWTLPFYFCERGDLMAEGWYTDRNIVRCEPCEFELVEVVT